MTKGRRGVVFRRRTGSPGSSLAHSGRNRKSAPACHRETSKFADRLEICPPSQCAIVTFGPDPEQLTLTGFIPPEFDAVKTHLNLFFTLSFHRYESMESS